MKYIQLTRGERAIIDDEDYDLVSQYCWHATTTKSYTYAATTIISDVGKRVTCLLHNFIKGQEQTRIIFKNGNRLDCRRDNLITKTKPKKKEKRKQTSKYRGVSLQISKPYYINKKGIKTLYKSHKSWRATIQQNLKSRFLGLFPNQIEAAKAYDMEAKKLLGDAAILNFPRKGKNK